MKNFIIIGCLVILALCGQSDKNRTLSLLKEWIGKEVRFPADMVFTIQGKDTVEYQIQNTYKIVSYVDSIGCTSCKLNLSGWKHFMVDIDSMSSQVTQFIFFLCPKKGMELYQALRVDQFKYPVHNPPRKEVEAKIRNRIEIVMCFPLF